jgi:hypothetical protein
VERTPARVAIDAVQAHALVAVPVGLIGAIIVTSTLLPVARRRPERIDCDRTVDRCMSVGAVASVLVAHGLADSCVEFTGRLDEVDVLRTNQPIAGNPILHVYRSATATPECAGGDGLAAPKRSCARAVIRSASSRSGCSPRDSRARDAAALVSARGEPFDLAGVKPLTWVGFCCWASLRSRCCGSMSRTPRP